VFDYKLFDISGLIG